MGSTESTSTQTENNNQQIYPQNKTNKWTELAYENDYWTFIKIDDKPGAISKEDCFAAVKNDGLTLVFVKDSWGFSNDELYKVAVQQNRLAFGLIPKEHRTQEIQDLVFQMPGDYEYPKNKSNIAKVLHAYGMTNKIGTAAMIFDISKQNYLKQQDDKYVELII